MPGADDLAHAVQIAHIAQQGHQRRVAGQGGYQCLQFVVDAVEGKFAVFDQQQRGRALAHDLPAQLAADAAARAGHQHHALLDVARNQFGARWHRVASQQVFHIQFLKLLHGGLAAGELVHAGHAAHVHGQPLQALDDGIAFGPCQARDG